MKLGIDDIDHLAKIGLEAAQIATAYISSQVDQVHDIQIKSEGGNLATQVVTAIDKESERLILEHLKKSIQEYDLGLLTEESEDDGSRFIKDYFWCIDPLDGTLPFTEHRAGYAVSIALVSKAGEPIIGVVIDPHTNKEYSAIRGKGCNVNGKAIHYQATSKNELVCHFDRSFIQASNYHSTIQGLELISKKLGYKHLQVHTGSGAVMNALSLLGTQAGCYFKFPKANRGGGCIWDFAATSLIYNELGLQVSDIYGNSLTLNNESSPYMNKLGVVYATDLALGKKLSILYESLAIND